MPTKTDWRAIAKAIRALEGSNLDQIDMAFKYAMRVVNHRTNKKDTHDMHCEILHTHSECIAKIREEIENIPLPPIPLLKGNEDAITETE